MAMRTFLELLLLSWSHPVLSFTPQLQYRPIGTHQLATVARQPSSHDVLHLESSTSFVSEADRAIRQGMRYEKNGQPRKASAAYHEAATLYQCAMDCPEFAHVTVVDDCDVVLAYACERLGWLNHDALGDDKAAVRLYQAAAAMQQSAAIYGGLGQSLEACCGGKDSLPQAIEAYQTALELDPGNHQIRFHLAVALERSGQEDQANTIFDRLRREEAVYACLVDSWGYIRWHTRKIKPLNLYRGTRSMLEVALKAAMPLIEQGGLVCEFGVGGGRSLRMTQEILPLNVPIHGFDTFTGLPQMWGLHPAGTFSTGGIVPSIEGNVLFHKGLFRDTIEPFLRDTGKDSFLAYGNIDCGLYSSSLDVLEAFHGRVVPGTVIVFDEYSGHPTWRQDEFRAWHECCKRFGWKYEYLAFSLSTNQAVVRIIDA